MNSNEEISDLILSFFRKMNEWEIECDSIDNSAAEYDEKVKVQRDSIRSIFETYCTKKTRKQGRVECISYGHEPSFDYDPEDEVIEEIKIEEKKAVVLTRRTRPMTKKNIYILKHTKSGWRIDSKKTFRNRTNKWQNIEI